MISRGGDVPLEGAWLYDSIRVFFDRAANEAQAFNAGYGSSDDGAAVLVPVDSRFFAKVRSETYMTTPSADTQRTLLACWAMNEPSNEEHLKELTTAILAQSGIPGVTSIEHGPRTAQVDWEGPDKAFDYAMIVGFEDMDAVRKYPSHPLHQQLVGSIYYVGDGDIRWFWLDC